MSPLSCRTFDAAAWPQMPLKFVCNFMVSNVDKHSFDDELPVRLCNYSDVYNNERVSPNMNLMAATATKEEVARFLLQVGDVVITKDSESWDDIGIPSYVEGAAHDFICGYHLAILRPERSVLDGRFLHRCLQARPIALQLELEAKGVTRYGLPQGAIGRLQLPVPSLATQQAVVDFLDRETAQIDGLIAQKESMLALLDEKRGALVSHVVTSGLNGHVPLKASGLEWVDQVPAHWVVCQLKRTWRSADYGLSESIRDEGEIAVLRMSCIVDGRVDATQAGRVGEVDERLLLRRDDLLFNRTNSLDQIAKVGLIDFDPGQPLTFASYLVRIRASERATPQFLSLLLNSSLFLAYARKCAIPAIGQANLNPTRYGEIHVPVPPLEEQEAIVRYLRQEAEKIEPVRSALLRSIQLLKDRRISLITEAVTGQIPMEEMAT